MGDPEVPVKRSLLSSVAMLVVIGAEAPAVERSLLVEKFGYPA